MSSPNRRSMSDGEGTSLALTTIAYPSSKKQNFQYFGWVYHLGVNKIGHEYCHLRFLFIRGKYAEMYKRDPHENPGIKPIRSGVVGQTLMVEDAGWRRVNRGLITSFTTVEVNMLDPNVVVLMPCEHEIGNSHYSGPSLICLNKFPNLCPYWCQEGRINAEQ
ncbi:hypothetical protein Cgig2_016872 [Carnegiea gigantea]|uniref:Uncharacterized protein n=1 Tax=Carnegiea gigantea TaxID=171969 RepID=A0A9Q1QCX4_9CARY|nr:hypothetical protein Cgig2_016872 [Carnegiea gigantea]